MPSVKWVVPQGRPRVFAVFKKITSLGRGAANDVVLDDRTIAEHHAQIVFDGRDFTAQEVDGALSVNGKRKRKAKIFHNDRLTLGDHVELVFSVYDEVVEAQHDDEEASRSAELAGMVRLSEFNRRLLEIRSVPEQIDALLDAVIEATDAAKGFIILLQDGEPRVASARNVDGTDIPDGVRHLSDSILHQVVSTKKPLIVSDALNDTLFRGSESVMNLKLCSVMCAPLMAQGQLLGLIYVGNDNVVSLFEQSSLDLLTIFAGQASLILQNALLLDQLSLDKKRVEEALDDKRFGDIIGSCGSIRDVMDKVDKVAGADVSVLITGETGTGKELIAREVHRRSRRKDGPFVVVNCGAIPENLMESELFGHVRGSFTGAVATRTGKFQQASGGTLFLDEIGEMPMNLQVKLLRALQEKIVTKVGSGEPEKVDIRVLAATNRDLERREPAPAAAARARRRRGGDREVAAREVHQGVRLEGEGLHAGRAGGDEEVRLAGEHSAAREPHQEGARARGQDAHRARRSRFVPGGAAAGATTDGGARGVHAALHPRGTRAQQRQPHEDRARSRRRSTHDLPVPGARARRADAGRR